MEIPLAVPIPSGLSISIFPADAEDIASIARITMLSQLPEAIFAFMWTDWPNTEHMLPSYVTRAAQKHSDPRSTLLKAVDVITGEIVGTVALTRANVPGEKEYVPKAPGGDGGEEAMRGMNVPFTVMVGELLGNFNKAMVGREHYLLSAFAVDPKYQSGGIGTKLMRRCQEIATENRVPIYLHAFPGAHDLYLRMGFVEQVRLDVDLNEWGKKNRGYGVYRGRGMLWEAEVDVKDT